LEPDPTLPSADWNKARCDVVTAKYHQICRAMPTRTILDLVRKPTIDMWQWEDYEVSGLLSFTKLRQTKKSELMLMGRATASV